MTLPSVYVSVPLACQDGRYYGPYPNGYNPNLPPMAAAAADATSASATLTLGGTTAHLAAAPSDTTTATATLTGGTPADTDATWTPATQNADGSAIAAGEVTGYQLGLRTSGSAGTYSIVLSIAQPYVSAALLAGIQPPLASGTYHAAIRSVGPVDSPWSTEVTFTV